MGEIVQRVDVEATNVNFVSLPKHLTTAEVTIPGVNKLGIIQEKTICNVGYT